MLAAGAITWTNNYLLADPVKMPGTFDIFEHTARIGIATGLAAGILVLVEKAAPDLAVILAWAAVVTVLFVRIPPNSNNPTPLERAFNL
jgi:hypothetical protein